MSFVDKFQKWLLKAEDKVKDKINSMTGKETFKNFNRDNVNTQYEISEKDISLREIRDIPNPNEDKLMNYQQIQNTENVNYEQETPRTQSDNFYPSFANVERKK